MDLNDDALALIESFEGFSSTWYPDPAHGWKVPTVAFGHTDAAGEPKFAATKGKSFTKAEGREILRRDVKKYADAVRSAVNVPLNANQFGALVSWCYNVGPGNVAKSTLVKKLNRGDYDAVPGELLKWNKAGGKVLKGLTRRRAAEGELFRKPAGKPASAQKPAPAPQTPAKPKPAPTATPVAKTGLAAVIAAAVLGAAAYVSTQLCNWIGVLCQ